MPVAYVLLGFLALTVGAALLAERYVRRAASAWRVADEGPVTDVAVRRVTETRRRRTGAMAHSTTTETFVFVVNDVRLANGAVYRSRGELDPRVAAGAKVRVWMSGVGAIRFEPLP